MGVDRQISDRKGEVWFAGQDIEESRAIKRESILPAYTTRYEGLPVAKWPHTLLFTISSPLKYNAARNLLIKEN